YLRSCPTRRSSDLAQQVYNQLTKIRNISRHNSLDFWGLQSLSLPRSSWVLHLLPSSTQVNCCCARQCDSRPVPYLRRAQTVCEGETVCKGECVRGRQCAGGSVCVCVCVCVSERQMEWRNKATENGRENREESDWQSF